MGWEAYAVLVAILTVAILVATLIVMGRARGRAAELEAFRDVLLMLDAAVDLDTTVNLIVLNVSGLIPAQTCAVYLVPEPDAPLKLAGKLAPPGLDLPAVIAGEALSCERWKLGDESACGFGVSDKSKPLAIDPSAKSHLYVTLRGTDSVEGLLYVARGKSQASFGSLQTSRLTLYAALICLPLQQARSQERLTNMAYMDTMTGLPNFRYFRKKLEEELSRSRRYGRPLSVILLDIDDFKLYNDTWGHRTGDALLEQLGMVLAGTLRESDIPTRYGGEEFIVLCPETSRDEAASIAERIRQNVADAVFTVPDEDKNAQGKGVVTASLGCATYPGDGSCEEDIIRAADRAMYAAKAAGRNTVRSA